MMSLRLPGALQPVALNTVTVLMNLEDTRSLQECHWKTSVYSVYWDVVTLER